MCSLTDQIGWCVLYLPPGNVCYRVQFNRFILGYETKVLCVGVQVMFYLYAGIFFSIMGALKHFEHFRCAKTFLSLLVGGICTGGLQVELAITIDFGESFVKATLI